MSIVNTCTYGKYLAKEEVFNKLSTVSMYKLLLVVELLLNIQCAVRFVLKRNKG